jgi:putative lipoprotein (rSAM/lipoprotein system)
LTIRSSHHNFVRLFKLHIMALKRNWVRGIIGGLSFTSALFVFQACYGMPQDMMDDFLVEGKVTSKSTGQPIKDIRVSVEDIGQFVHTNSQGEFGFYTTWRENMTLLFQDVDAAANGSYASRDTMLSDLSDKVFVDIALEEK